MVNFLAGGILNIKHEYEHSDKQCETCTLRYKDCKCSLEYTNFKDDLTEYSCLCCNKNYQSSLMKT